MVSGALAGFYVAVLTLSGGWEHFVDQARADWWLLTPITLAFGTQVALSVELGLDVARRATFTVGGQPWTDPVWDGAGPGGHHREGTLVFTSTGPPTGDAVLTVEGLDEPLTARWALPQGT